MDEVHWRKLSCGKRGWYTVSRVARMARTSSEVWLAMREKGASLSKRRRNCSQVGSGRSNVSFKGIVSPDPAATRHKPSGWSYCNRPWSVTSLSNIRCSKERSCASSTIKNSVLYWCRCPMMVPLAGTPMPSDRQAKRRKELVAQGLLIVIVFGRHHRENGSSASPFLQVTDTHGEALARISHDQMEGPIVPGVLQHLLKTFREGGFDENI